MSDFPKIRWYQHVEWIILMALLTIISLAILTVGYTNSTPRDFDECKTVEVVGSCTRYDCRVGFTDETHGTLRGPALQGDLVCKYAHRNFWQMPKK